MVQTCSWGLDAIKSCLPHVRCQPVWKTHCDDHCGMIQTVCVFHHQFVMLNQTLLHCLATKPIVDWEICHNQNTPPSPNGFFFLPSCPPHPLHLLLSRAALTLEWWTSWRWPLSLRPRTLFHVDETETDENICARLGVSGDMGQWHSEISFGVIGT